MKVICFVVALASVLLCVNADISTQFCRPNEFLSFSCAQCDEPCSDIAPGTTSLCQSICAPGCRCNKGYCRNSVNQCVPIAPIPTPIVFTPPPGPPPGCGINEVYIPPDGCESGCTSCASLRQLPTPRVCLAVCSTGCLCKPGYCRDTDNNCVQAVPECGPNMQHSAQCRLECVCNTLYSCSVRFTCEKCKCKIGYCRRNGHCVRRYF
uniref:Zonadhesin n=1 Tax=Phallusia mammillata TaxID=59560 RepID=A0A6F9DY03_9ASCI|nr:zonadhesin [Phallusia mammillata]